MQSSFFGIRTKLSTHLLIELFEQVVAPCHERQLIDLVHILTALLALAADPVAVEVGANAVEDLARELVLLPLLGVECEHVLAHQVDSLAFQLHQVVLEEVLQALVEFQANELGPSSRSLLLDALTAATNSFTVACVAQTRLLVDAGAVVIDVAAESD